ncbi:unnamed protein product [Ectocarpus fasciculatus]
MSVFSDSLHLCPPVRSCVPSFFSQCGNIIMCTETHVPVIGVPHACVQCLLRSLGRTKYVFYAPSRRFSSVLKEDTPRKKMFLFAWRRSHVYRSTWLFSAQAL